MAADKSYHTGALIVIHVVAHMVPQQPLRGKSLGAVSTGSVADPKRSGDGCDLRTWCCWQTCPRRWDRPPPSPGYGCGGALEAYGSP